MWEQLSMYSHDKVKMKIIAEIVDQFILSLWNCAISLVVCMHTTVLCYIYMPAYFDYTWCKVSAMLNRFIPIHENHLNDYAVVCSGTFA